MLFSNGVYRWKEHCSVLTGDFNKSNWSTEQYTDLFYRLIHSSHHVKTSKGRVNSCSTPYWLPINQSDFPLTAWPMLLLFVTVCKLLYTGHVSLSQVDIHPRLRRSRNLRKATLALADGTSKIQQNPRAMKMFIFIAISALNLPQRSHLKKC